jgi:tRNA(Ile)-lysidine synthetase-like protein
MVLALAGCTRDAAEIFVVAHIVHDLRPRAEALADRDAARALALRVGIPFVEAAIEARPLGGNAEGQARRLRYEALERLAAEHACPFIATAHHADDQLETMLMALLRGTGPRGLAGIARTRRLSRRVRVVRPMLGVTREATQEICRRAGWPWREDATNRDPARLRSALRIEVMPVLEQLRPGASVRAARTADLLRGAAAIIRRRARELHPVTRNGGPVWDRAVLQREPPVIVGEVLRRAAASLRGGRGRDRLGAAALESAIRAIRSRPPRGTEPRRFAWSGLTVLVTAHAVEVRPTP